MAPKATAPRRAAFDILAAVREGELVDRALSRIGAPLEPRDFGWLQELVYGTFRLRGRIDHILGAFMRKGLESAGPDVLDVLRLGTYQLLQMDSVPAYAAVSQSVDLVRDTGNPNAAGFVNGVLQSVRRQGARIEFPDFDSDPVGHLVTWGSHPRWLVQRWVDRWGAREAQKLVEANNTRPDIFLSPVGVPDTEALERLRAAGLEAHEVDGFGSSVRLGSGTNPVAALAAIPAVVQDPAAAAVADFAAFPEGSQLLDISAAPGGKTTLIAEKARYVAANDLSVAKLRRVRANVQRSGVADRVGLVVADGRRPPFREMDGVLLDAPCTGTGTLRRHPDGRWRISEEDLKALSTVQAELLDGAASRVRVGGVLVYSTCSIEPEENELQVESFLGRHPNFEPATPARQRWATMMDEGYLKILPQRHGVDGAFAARLRRVS